MKTIPLTKGYEAVVDDEDYDRVSAFDWMAKIVERKHGSPRIYAKRLFKDLNTGKTKSWQLHRFILNVHNHLKSIQVDHIDGNPLNNQKSNLRICSISENLRNRICVSGSGFKGVSLQKHYGNYRAYIRPNGKMIHLGIFSSPVLAALAYDAAARKYFGDFARLNFPDIANENNAPSIRRLG